MATVFSTRYTQRGQARWYTTKTLTEFHAHLRKNCEGQTFEHPETAKLEFIPGFPLTTPTKYVRRVQE